MAATASGTPAALGGTEGSRLCPPRAGYELPLPETVVAPQRPPDEAAEPLSEALLTGNALWFIRLRWVATFLLGLLGVLGVTAQGLFADLGLRPPSGWPFVVSGILLLANLLFLGHARGLGGWQARLGPQGNLWGQILFDLIVDDDEDWLPVSDFLEKPVDLDVLSARVTAMLSGRGGA